MSTINAPDGCLCGVIRYRIIAAPLVTNLCHCRSCRLATGEPAAAWVMLPRDGLVFDRRSTSTPRRSTSPTRSAATRAAAVARA